MSLTKKIIESVDEVADHAPLSHGSDTPQPRSSLKTELTDRRSLATAMTVRDWEITGIPRRTVELIIDTFLRYHPLNIDYLRRIAAEDDSLLK